MTVRRAAAQIENSLDLLLTLLYAPGSTGCRIEPVCGITRLQKLIFLLWKEGFCQDVPNLYNFKACDFGPRMDDLFDDLAFAEEIGLLSVTEVPSGNKYEGADEDAFVRTFDLPVAGNVGKHKYMLTNIGNDPGGEFFEGLMQADRKAVVRVKCRFNLMPFWVLVRYVYRKYPAFACNAVLQV